jgi:hypothetical protein
MSIEIEKGIPVPPPMNGKTGLRAILADMDVGDSFLWPKVKRGGLFTYFRLEPGKRFISRAINEESVRVWRTE